MFNVIAAKVCQGVGWSFMQNFRKFHGIFFNLYKFEIFRQVDWLGMFDFSKSSETLQHNRQSHDMIPYKKSSQSVNSSLSNGLSKFR